MLNIKQAKAGSNSRSPDETMLSNLTRETQKFQKQKRKDQKLIRKCSKMIKNQSKLELKVKSILEDTKSRSNAIESNE